MLFSVLMTLGGFSFFFGEWRYLRERGDLKGARSIRNFGLSFCLFLLVYTGSIISGRASSKKPTPLKPVEILVLLAVPPTMYKTGRAFQKRIRPED